MSYFAIGCRSFVIANTVQKIGNVHQVEVIAGANSISNVLAVGFITPFLDYVASFIVYRVGIAARIDDCAVVAVKHCPTVGAIHLKTVSNSS